METKHCCVYGIHCVYNRNYLSITYFPDGYDPNRTKVYRIDSEGIATELESIIVDVEEGISFIGFNANHFSLYAIAEMPETIQPNPGPDTSINSNPGQSSETATNNTSHPSNIPATGDTTPYLGITVLLGSAILLIIGRKVKSHR